MNFDLTPAAANNRKRPEQLVDSKTAKKPIKILIQNQQSPGDVVVLTAAIRDLHRCYPGWFQTDVFTSCPAIFENNPFITKLKPGDPEVTVFKAEYDLIHTSNHGAHHFLHGFIKDLNDRLGLNIEPTEFKGDIHIGEKEKSWFSQVYEIIGKDIPYWIINAGSKNDFTCKQWEFARYQEVVDKMPDVTFVQVGAKEHNHKHLKGKNVIGLVGKTDLRQLIRLIYHSAGVITCVSLAMHLAAAIEMPPRYNRPARPCIVIAGGREPSAWEAYTNHQFLHTCGMLKCCAFGGCWASRVEPIGDGDPKDKENLCKLPVVSKSGQKIPKCMDMITADDVIEKIEQYIEGWQ